MTDINKILCDLGQAIVKACETLPGAFNKLTKATPKKESPKTISRQLIKKAKSNKAIIIKKQTNSHHYRNNC